MGRPSTPTAVLDARGAFLHNPQLRRENEPKTARPLGPAPKWLSDDEKNVWKDLAKQAIPGVLMYSDRLLFEVLVCLVNQFRQGTVMAASDKSMLVNLASKFAMSPSDRAKVQVEQPKESKLTKFLKHADTRRPAPPAPTFDAAAPVN
jgi:phage terminase small subunit